MNLLIIQLMDGELNVRYKSDGIDDMKVALTKIRHFTRLWHVFPHQLMVHLYVSKLSFVPTQTAHTNTAPVFHDTLQG